MLLERAKKRDKSTKKLAPPGKVRRELFPYSPFLFLLFMPLAMPQRETPWLSLFSTAHNRADKRDLGEMRGSGVKRAKRDYKQAKKGRGRKASGRLFLSSGS